MEILVAAMQPFVKRSHRPYYFPVAFEQLGGINFSHSQLNASNRWQPALRPPYSEQLLTVFEVKDIWFQYTYTTALLFIQIEQFESIWVFYFLSRNKDTGMVWFRVSGERLGKFTWSVTL